MNLFCFILVVLICWGLAFLLGLGYDLSQWMFHTQNTLLLSAYGTITIVNNILDLILVVSFRVGSVLFRVELGLSLLLSWLPSVYHWLQNPLEFLILVCLARKFSSNFPWLSALGFPFVIVPHRRFVYIFVFP